MEICAQSVDPEMIGRPISETWVNREGDAELCLKKQVTFKNYTNRMQESRNVENSDGLSNVCYLKKDIV